MTIETYRGFAIKPSSFRQGLFYSVLGDTGQSILRDGSGLTGGSPDEMYFDDPTRLKAAIDLHLDGPREAEPAPPGRAIRGPVAWLTRQDYSGFLSAMKPGDTLLIEAT